MSAAPRPVVILGATGFLGTALTWRFQRGPGYDVAALGSRDLDLNAPDAATQLARRLRPDCELIVAARARSVPDPLTQLRRDVDLILSVVRALEIQPVRRCVYLSSSAVYGDDQSNLGITEETPPAPTNLYGLAKLTSERLLAQVARQASIPLLSVRPCLIYGPGDTSRAYGPPRFLHALREGGRIELYGEGGDRRDYVHVDDFAEIIWRLNCGGCHGVYNVASGSSVSFCDVVALLQRLWQRPFEVVSVPQRRPCIEQGFDVSKLQAALGDFSCVPLETGLAKTVACLVNG
jgi:UDP-glucose 4-epimerase